MPYLKGVADPSMCRWLNLYTSCPSGSVLEHIEYIPTFNFDNKNFKVEWMNLWVDEFVIGLSWDWDEL